MEKIFVTGATGFIGSQLCLALAGEGYKVYALYRDQSKVEALKHANIECVKGDLFSIDVLIETMSLCDGLFHTAACAKLWTKDKREYHRTNVEGTQNIIHAALQAGIKRGVFTSSAGVLGPSNGTMITETQQRAVPFFNDYERTKAAADELVRTIPVSAMETVIVYPTRVYGPGMLNESNGVTRMVKQYLMGKWHTIPGNGRSVGNYVYIDDVVRGHIQAFRQGKAGQNYILAGENLTYNEFFNHLKLLSQSNFWLMKVPANMILFIALLMGGVTSITQKAPLLTPDLARKFLYNWNTTSNKAKADFNYRPITFDEGLRRTIEWLNAHNHA